MKTMKFRIDRIFLKWTPDLPIINQMSWESSDNFHSQQANSIVNNSAQRKKQGMADPQSVSRDQHEQDFRAVVAKIDENPELQARFLLKYQKQLNNKYKLQISRKKDEVRLQNILLERQKEHSENQRLKARVEALKIVSGMNLKDFTLQRLELLLEKSFAARQHTGNEEQDSKSLGVTKEKKITKAGPKKRQMKPDHHRIVQKILKKGVSIAEVASLLGVTEWQIQHIGKKTFESDSEVAL